MPDQAFSKISTLAGPELPARHQTLNYFLKSTLNRKTDRRRIINAVEAEPRILVHFLAAMRPAHIAKWHEGLTDQALSEQTFEQAVVMANSANLNETGKSWQQAFLASEVARVLATAAKFDDDEVSRCRCLALMLRIGSEHLMDQTQLDKGLEAKEGADLLGRFGLSRADCDLLRYHHEGLEILRDAGDDLVLVAISGRLAEAMMTDFELADQYFELIHEKLEINPGHLSSLLEQAYSTFRVHNDELLSLTDFAENLSRANLVVQMQSCEKIEPLTLLSREVFAIQRLGLARREQNNLVISLDDDEFSVGAESGGSLLTQVFQSQSPFSAEENALVAIVDKQLLSRFATNALWFVPLGPLGLAVCGVDSFDHQARRDELLVAAFSKACGRLLQGAFAPTAPMIELDQVQRRVRELTHEVNNPLSIVQNYLKTLSLKLDHDSNVQTDIQTISSEMLRIGGIIQKYAHIGTEDKSELALVDVNALLQSLIGVVQGSHANIKLQCALDPLMPKIVSNADSLKQILINLLKNAAEAFAPKPELATEPEPQINVHSNGRVNLGGQHFVEIVVEDNGPGVAPEIYQNLFIANHSGKGGDHSGIGLSVAHRLITELGGLISCKTSAATGTQFQILLPIEEQQSVEQRKTP